MTDEGALPTGRQFRLSRDGARGRVEATVTELGASLRALRVGGLACVREYDDALPPPGGAGVVLVPWPNRVAGATWTLDGAEQHLDVSEPSTGNASHGLLRNAGYTPAEQSAGSVRLSAGIFPQHGWPFRLDTSVTYALTDDGVEVAHQVTNLGDRPAPVALGTHPYLCVGDSPTDSLVLTVRAATYDEVDGRGIPVGTHPVDASDVDLRQGRRLGDVVLDTAYGDLDTDADGTARHRLADDRGRAVELWQDRTFAWAQVFTKPSWPAADGLGRAVAVEPMTAPADALNSGRGLRWLEPGASLHCRWGIRAVDVG